VLACKECNKKWQRDSDYLRECFVFLLAESTHPTVQEMRERSIRAHANRIERGKRASLLTVRRRARDADGRYVFRDEETVDLERLGHILLRSVMVLRFATPLSPETDEFNIYFRLIQSSEPDFQRAVAFVSENGRSAAGTLLKWRYIAGKEAGESEWVLTFYDQIAFVAQSAHKSKLELTSLVFGTPFATGGVTYAPRPFSKLPPSAKTVIHNQLNLLRGPDTSQMRKIVLTREDAQHPERALIKVCESLNGRQPTPDELAAMPHSKNSAKL
jgi:hypothetical protein